MTVGSLMLAERLTFLDSMARTMERKIAEDPIGQPELVGRWTQAVNSMMGLIKTLKLDRNRDNSVIDALYQYDDEDPGNTPEDAPDTPSEPPESKCLLKVRDIVPERPGLYIHPLNGLPLCSF